MDNMFIIVMMLYKSPRFDVQILSHIYDYVCMILCMTTCYNTRHIRDRHVCVRVYVYVYVYVLVYTPCGHWIRCSL